MPGKLREASGKTVKLTNREKTGESYVTSPFMEKQWLTFIDRLGEAT